MNPIASDIVSEVHITKPEHAAPQCSSCGQLAISPAKTQCGEFICLHCIPSHTACVCEVSSCSLCPLTDFERYSLSSFFSCCPFKHRGCQEVVPITDVAAHIQGCTFKGDTPQPCQLVTDVCIHSPQEEEPICSHCDNVAISPMVTQCGELLCLHCHSTHSTCPCCQESECSFRSITDAVRDKYRRFFCTCPFQNQGCEQIIPITDLDVHLRFCPHATILCPDCSIPVTNADLPFHLHGSCSKRRVQCFDCGEEVPVEGYFQHDEDEHPTCVGCGTRYHIPTEGKQHQLVQCNVCSQKLLVCMMEKHMADAGHVEKLQGELKVVQTQLQEAEDEVIIQDDPALKKMQDQHEIIHCSTFSQQYKGKHVELLDGGRTVRKIRSYVQISAILNHPGFDKGIYEWEIKILKNNGDITIGASPPGLVGNYPGSETMPGTIGLDSNGFIGIRSRWSRPEGCFRFTTGDTILLRLDFTSRTITWTMKSDRLKTHTRPLPQAGPYVPAVGFIGKGSSVRIESFRRVE